MKQFFPVILAVAANVCPAGEWPQWRGPEGNGSVREGVIPSDLTKPVWKKELPGRGCSTPAICGELIILTAPVDGKDAVLCYDLKGELKWQKVFQKQMPGRGQRVGSGANSSPVIDGGMVFAYFKSGKLAAMTVKGEVKWEKNVYELYGENKLWWDNGTSPVATSHGVVITLMQTDAPSYMVSFDKKTGAEQWKVDRKFDVGKESGDSYTTPQVYRLNGHETLVSFGADHVTGHCVKGGKQMWFCGGLNPGKKDFWRVIASPVQTRGILVVPHGRASWLAGIKLGGEGDVTEKGLLWRKKITSSDSPTPVAKDGRVILLSDQGKKRGTITYVEAATGEVIWEDQLPRAASTYYASPLLVGNTVCCLREDGMVFTADLGKKGLENVKSVKLNDTFIASPVHTGTKFFLRGDKYLWCFE